MGSSQTGHEDFQLRKEELEEVEIMQSRGSLRKQRESLMKAECRMEEAKELTPELLGRHFSDREEALVVNEHWKRENF